MQQLQVMIIEDDFRIARIHKEIVESDDSFTVIQSCLTAKDALAYLADTLEQPDIILLDIFIPDIVGMKLLEALKKESPYAAIIIVSAANDTETIQHALLLGIFDYIIKPIDQERLQAALRHVKACLSLSSKEMTQHELDGLLETKKDVGNQNKNPIRQGLLPKGIDTLTLEEVKVFLQSSQEKDITAHTLASSLGTSRSTARRYLEYLVTLNIIRVSSNYGQVGRPQRIYTIT